MNISPLFVIRSLHLIQPQGYLDSYSTLHWVTSEALTCVEVIPSRLLIRHTLANGSLFYPSQDGSVQFFHKILYATCVNRSRIRPDINSNVHR